MITKILRLSLKNVMIQIIKFGQSTRKHFHSYQKKLKWKSPFHFPFAQSVLLRSQYLPLDAMYKSDAL